MKAYLIHILLFDSFVYVLSVSYLSVVYAMHKRLKDKTLTHMLRQYNIYLQVL